MNKVFIILIKSVFSSIAIGYLLYSFIYINNNDFCSPSNILDSSCYLDNPHAEGKNIIKDQPVILASYISWLKNASKLDFGEFSKNNSREVFPFAINRFITSIKLILLSVLISFIFSLVIHFSSQNQLLRDYLAEPFISLSFLHIIIYAIIFKSFVSIGTVSFLSTIVICSIIAISSGMLYDYYALLKNEHDNIVNKDYVVFAFNSGLNKYVFAAKELIISFIYITISRIPLLFAGMAILEILSKGKYYGIGYTIWYYVNKASPKNYAIFFGSTIITIIFFTFIYFLSEHIKNKLSPKAQKT